MTPTTETTHETTANGAPSEDAIESDHTELETIRDRIAADKARMAELAADRIKTIESDMQALADEKRELLEVLGQPAEGEAKPRRGRKPAESGAKAPAAAKAPRAAKGTASANVEGTLATVLKYLAKGPRRSEAIREATGIDKKDLAKALKYGVEAKKLKTTGQKRATEYRAA